MAQELAGIPTTRRRTVLKAIGAGTTGVAFLSTNTTAQSSSIGGVVFEDEFEDGQLDWTDVDHPEFWSEQDGQIQYSPSTSAGSTGDNYLYADETFDGDEGLLEWPVALEFRGYASDTSAGLGAFATDGGPKDGRGDVCLGIQDGKYNDQFHVWNSEGEQFTLSGARENNTWYTYRLVPDLENNEIQISRNDESWTVPEPNDDPIENTSIALSGGTCWGCGGTGDRRYEYIKVSDIPLKPISDTVTTDFTIDEVSEINSGAAGTYGFATNSLDELSDRRNEEEIREALIRSGWNENEPGMIIFSEVATLSIGPAVTGLDQRVGALTYHDSFTVDTSGTYDLTFKPNMYIGAAAGERGFMSVNKGGSSASVKMHINVVDVDEERVVVEDTKDLEARKYPEDFDPSSDGEFGQIAEDLGEIAITELIAHLYGLGKGYGLLVETASFLTRDPTDMGEIQLDEPSQVEASLQKGHEYEWHVMFIGDTRSALTTHLSYQRTSSLVVVHGETNLLSVDEIN